MFNLPSETYENVEARVRPRFSHAIEHNPAVV